MCVIYIILTHINLIIIYIAIYIMYDGSTLCWYALENDYLMAANFSWGANFHYLCGSFDSHENLYTRKLMPIQYYYMGNQ